MVADGRQGREPLTALRDFVSDLVAIRSVDATFARLLRHLVVQTGAQGACVVDRNGRIRSDWWRGAVTGTPLPDGPTPAPWPGGDAEVPAWARLDLPGQPLTVWLLFERELPRPATRRLAELSVQLLALAPALGDDPAGVSPLEVTAAVRGGLTPDQILGRTAELFVPRLADVCVVYDHRQGDLLPVAARRSDGEAIDLDDLSDPPMQAWVAADERESQIVDRSDDPSGYPEAAPGLETQNAMFLPLVSSGHTLGAIGLYTTDDFDLRDLELAELIAGSTAAALLASSAQVDAKRMADVLVKASLPARIPTIPGFELAAVYVPVSDAAEVGGDWYDAIELRGGRVGFVVGDVVGHGLSAATTMSQLRNGLRAFLAEGHGPARALALLNNLAQMGNSSELATVLVGILDPNDGTVRTAAAGAVPPLLVRASSAPTVDPEGQKLSSGPLVGAFADADYSEQLWTLAEGDLFLAFTDGVVERRDRDIEDGRQWLAERAHTRPYGPPDAFCDLLVHDLRSDGAGEDDICLLALERTPREQTALRRAIAPDTALLSSLRGEVRLLLEGVERAIAERTLDDVELVLAELLANAVEASPENEQIEVYVGYGTGRITIEVIDRGKGFTPPTEISVEPMAERGRGLLLVHAIADRVDVRSADDGTHVRAVVRTQDS